MQCISASKFELVKVNVRGSGAKGRAGRLRVLNRVTMSNLISICMNTILASWISRWRA